MCDPKDRECFYLKVDHDFEYTTNDGRRIAIKRDEKLRLLQKTNNDWWKVVRSKEQRSFYVPATYVRELGETLSSDENFERVCEDRSARREHVEKWLSDGMGIAQGAAGSLENLEEQNLRIAGKIDDRGRGKKESKGLERFRNVVKRLSSGKYASGNSSLVAAPAKTTTLMGDSLRPSLQNADIESTPASNGPAYPPTKAKKLDRNSSDSLTLRSHEIPHGISQNPKTTIRRGDSTDSAGSSDDRLSTTSDSTPIANDRKATFDEELNYTVQNNNVIKRYSDSGVDCRFAKPNIEDGPNSPISTGKKTTPPLVSVPPRSAGDGCDRSDNAMKILNDKRKSWAVEELMSELTQIRKERVDDNTSTFILRSVAIEDRFDPLEKLTQELHDLQVSQVENSVTASSESKRHGDENVGKGSAAISPFKAKEALCVSSKSSKHQLDIQGQRAVPAVECTSDKSKSPKAGTQLTDDKACSIQANFHASKLSKRQDEYEEANILNDESTMRGGSRGDGGDKRVSLSADRRPCLSSYRERSQLFNTDIDNSDNLEKPSYSNISVKLENEAKIRPELRLKIKSVDTKIKLTPSLEKLASQIQFLPAGRASIIDSDERKSSSAKASLLQDVDYKDKQSPIPKKFSPNSDKPTHASPDEEMWKNVKSKLNYKSSIKSKQVDKPEFVAEDEGCAPDRSQRVGRLDKAKLKKSATFNCVVLPEYYKHFQRHRDFRVNSMRKTNRRSRSLEGARLSIDTESGTTAATPRKSEDVEKSSAIMKPKLSQGPSAVAKPVPALRDAKGKVDCVLSGSREGVARHPQVLRSSISKSYENLSQDTTNPTVYDAYKSTAVSFKNLLCTSDSGSDEYLHYKAFPKSVLSPSEHSALSSDRKSNRKSIVSSENLPFMDRSGHDEPVLSPDISSEALFSQSESEAYALSELSNNSSPVPIDRDRDNFVNLPPGWSQEYDFRSKQICFVNVRGEKGGINSKEITRSHYKWLTADLEKRILQNFESNCIKAMSSMFDWLREIRFECAGDVHDFLDSRGKVSGGSVDEWFSSNDAEGKIYFFEENSNESSWLLPTVSIVEPTLQNTEEKYQDVELRPSGGGEKIRIGKARSLVVGNQRASKKEIAARRSGSVSHDWPQLFDGNMCILKEGTLQRAKITENGKRLRKHWSASYVVLSELFLLFFKDAKSFSAMKLGQSAAAKPDISVDLNGATIQPDEKASSRKNVYIVSTVLGLQVLIQSDNTVVANEWYQEIQDMINKLPSGVDVQTTYSPPTSERPRDVKGKLLLPVSSIDETKAVSKVGRSRSLKIKRIDGSTEDLSGSSAERQTKIRAKLKRFFQRRPTVETLVKNGIYKDEPAFGSYLKDVCSRQSPMVPQFVKDCIKILERNPENMKADGLYRASGNLSQIQKIRLQVDQNNLDILEQEEDVHVLTGALKLFFRELKEPLIPYEFFEKALNGSLAKKRSERIQIFREIVRGLSQAHYDTLQFLLQHLLRVTTYQRFNRMHIPNLAIVFGPTLMWPAVESTNMALDLMQQNLVIECLLSEYDKIFK